MCYCGCPYERYPSGIYEGCECTLPKGACCPLSGDCDPPSDPFLDDKIKESKEERELKQGFK